MALPATPTYDINALLKQYVPAAPSAAALDRIAQRKAQDSTNEQIGVYRRAEQNDLQQAAMRAQQINAATLASAGYLDHLGFGERLRSAFQQAGQDQAQIAQGFSGDLRNTAGAAAARVQANLASLGAPGSGPGGVNDGSQAANVVYGLGAIPANVLTASAPLALARAQAYSAQLIGAGQAEAVGAIGAGQQAAARYQPEIANAVAKMPALEQTYLTQLTSAAAKSRQDAIGNLFKALDFQRQGDTAAATAAYRQAQLDASASHNASLEAAAIDRNNISRYGATTSRMNANTSRENADTSQTRANNDVTKYNNSLKPVYNASISNSLGFRADQFGNPVGGKISPLPKYKLNEAGDGVVPRKVSGKVTTGQAAAFPNLSKSQVLHLRRGTAGAFYGVPAEKDVDGKVTRAALPPVDYWAAIEEGVKAGYSRAGATKMANRFYMPGQRGRPGRGKSVAAAGGQFFSSLPGNAGFPLIGG